MNILPKKSWHVRTKQNIERVRRDEAQAAEEEKERQRRVALAESEARTEALRLKSRKRRRKDDDVESGQLVASSGGQLLAPSGGQVVESSGGQLVAPSGDLLVASSGHINFFQDEEEGKKTGGTNAEHEAEKKEEKEKQEKAIGLLTYLGQSAIESQTEKPWYFQPPKKHQKTEEKPTCTSVSSHKMREEFDLKSKWSQDPLKQMSGFIRQKEKIVQRDKDEGTIHSKPCFIKSGHTSKGEQSLSHEKLRKASESSVHTTKRSKHKRHKKEQKKKKSKHKSKEKHKKKKKKSKNHDLVDLVKLKTSDSSLVVLSETASPSGGKSIQQLRAERLKREREERRRSDEFLAKSRGDVPKEKTKEFDDRERRYNSQFNPELVRKKRKRDDMDINIS